MNKAYYKYLIDVLSSMSGDADKEIERLEEKIDEIKDKAFEKDRDLTEKEEERCDGYLDEQVFIGESVRDALKEIVDNVKEFIEN